MSANVAHPYARKKATIGQLTMRIIMVIIGALIFAVGLDLFLVSNNVMDGGIVGVSIILSHLLGIPLGVFIFFLNLPFIYLGYKQIGKTFALTTALGITVLSIATVIMLQFKAFTSDLLLATIFGGILLGLGVGIVIRYSGCLDGTEVLAILLNKKLPFSVGEIILFINLIIFSVAGFVFTWEKAMYSIVAYYIASKMIDIVVLGMEESKSAYIISDEIEEIGNAILSRLGRGVTYLHGEGAYTGNNKKVIFCVITRLEEAKLKEIVRSIDTQAFLALGNISEVRGGRFKKKDIH